MRIMPQPRLLEIVTEPDDRLHEKSSDVQMVDNEIRQLMQDMLFSMHRNRGIGLAAVQVGVKKNVIVVDAKHILSSDMASNQSDKCEEYLYMANPEIIEISEEKEVCSEGCLSYPGIQVDVSRAKWVTIKYLNQWNETLTLTTYGLLARCILHEIDHTRGKVLPDYLSPIKKDKVLKDLAKIKKTSKL